MTVPKEQPDSATIWTIHGIVPSDAPHPPDAPPHHTMVVGELKALVTDRPAPQSTDVPDLDTESALVLTHNRLLVAYGAVSDVVPVRYGACLSAKDEVIARVAEQADVHHQVLHRVAGAQEYSVRIEGVMPHSQPTETPAAPTSGRGYLASRRTARDARDRRAEERNSFLRQAASRLAACARECSASAPNPDRLLDLNLLVARTETAAFLRAAEQIYTDAAALDLALKVSGPWPPYTFAGPITVERATS